MTCDHSLPATPTATPSCGVPAAPAQRRYFSSISALPTCSRCRKIRGGPVSASKVIVAELARRPRGIRHRSITDEGPRGQVGFEHRDLFAPTCSWSRRWWCPPSVSARSPISVTPYDENNRFIGFGQRLEREDIEDLVTLRSNTYAGFGRRDGDIESFTSLQYQVERERIRAAAAASTNGLADGAGLGRRGLCAGSTELDPRKGYAITAQLSGARKGSSPTAASCAFIPARPGSSRCRRHRVQGRHPDGLVELGASARARVKTFRARTCSVPAACKSIRGYAYQSLGVPRGGASSAAVPGSASLNTSNRITDDYAAAAAFVDYATPPLAQRLRSGCRLRRRACAGARRSGR